MRINYMSLSYFPSRRASTVQVSRMCEAFALNGHEVDLTVKRAPAQPELDSAIAGVDVYRAPRPQVRGGELVFSAAAAAHLLRTTPDLVYARHLYSAMVAVTCGYRVVVELHELPKVSSRSLAARLLRSDQVCRIVTITEALRLDTVRALPALDPAKLVVAHDGAAPMHLSHRRRGGRGVVYMGGFHPGKGATTVLEIAKRVPEVGFTLIGGSPSEIAELAPTAGPNVTFRGHLAHSLVRRELEQFDIALLPMRRTVTGASRSTNIARWTSPLKLFEYMAVGLPIVVSDLPVLREVVNDQNSLLVDVDDLDAWAVAVRRLHRDPVLAARLGVEARRCLETTYAWSKRAEYVLRGL